MDRCSICQTKPQHMAWDFDLASIVGVMNVASLEPIQSLCVALFALHINQHLSNVGVEHWKLCFSSKFFSLVHSRASLKIGNVLAMHRVRQSLSAFRAIRSALIGFSLVVLQNSLSGANANFLTLKDFGFNYTRYGLEKKHKPRLTFLCNSLQLRGKNGCC